MHKMMRLGLAAVMAFAFATAWADDSKSCEPKDMPCTAAVAQDGSESAESSGDGAGSGETTAMSSEYSEDQAQRMEFEAWEVGGG